MSSTDGRLDLDRLEAAVEGAVLLDVLAVLVERGRADALELAARERGLEDVGGVHRALGGAGADDRVQLVDEEDDVPGALDLVHHGLDALLELAAVLGAGDHEREVEGDDLLVEEDLRARCRRRSPGPGPRRSRSCRRRPRRSGRGCSSCAGRGSGSRGGSRSCGPTTGSISPLRASSVRSRPKALRAGVLTSFFSSAWAPGRCGAAGGGLLAAALAAAGELGIELAQDLVARALDVDVEGLEDAGGDALALAQEAEQDVLGADIGMVERLRLLAGERQDLLHPRACRGCCPGPWPPGRCPPASRRRRARSRGRAPSSGARSRPRPGPA